MKMELEYIEKLAELVSKNNLTELSLEDGERALIIKKEKEIITTTQAIPAALAAAPAPQAVPQQAETPKMPKVQEVSNTIKITSPMVGTFYRSSSPGTTPFIDVGKTVSTDQVVCIIEAMKLMNEIESEVSGKVVEICVKDGEPVEFGQTLMIIEP